MNASYDYDDDWWHSGVEDGIELLDDHCKFASALALRETAKRLGEEDLDKLRYWYKRRFIEPRPDDQD